MEEIIEDERDYLAAIFAAAWVPVLASRAHPDRSYTQIAREANELGIAQADAMIAQRRK